MSSSWKCVRESLTQFQCADCTEFWCCERAQAFPRHPGHAQLPLFPLVPAFPTHPYLSISIYAITTTPSLPRLFCSGTPLGINRSHHCRGYYWSWDEIGHIVATTDPFSNRRYVAQFFTPPSILHGVLTFLSSGAFSFYSGTHNYPQSGQPCPRTPPCDQKPHCRLQLSILRHAFLSFKTMYDCTFPRKSHFSTTPAPR